MLKNNCFYIKLIVLSISVCCFISCDVIGEKLEKEKALPENEIVSFNDIDLKKGDQLAIWTHISTQFKEGEKPTFNIKYHIEKDGLTQAFDTYNPFEFNHSINAVKNKKAYTSENQDGEEVINYRTSLEFEAESTVYEVLEDGIYTFDFKLYKEDGEYTRDSFAIYLTLR